MDCYWQDIVHIEIWSLRWNKTEFFPAIAISVLLYGFTTLNNETLGEKASWELYKDTVCCSEHRSAVSIAAEIEEVKGQPVSAQTIRRTLHQIGVYGCHPRRKPLLKTIHKKAHKQFVEHMSTKHMDYWNHVLRSDEMKINLFGSDGFKHVWRRPGEEYKDKCVMPTVKHGGGNVMV